MSLKYGNITIFKTVIISDHDSFKTLTENHIFCWNWLKPKLRF